MVWYGFSGMVCLGRVRSGEAGQGMVRFGFCGEVRLGLVGFGVDFVAG